MADMLLSSFAPANPELSMISGVKEVEGEVLMFLKWDIVDRGTCTVGVTISSQIRNSVYVFRLRVVVLL